MMACAIGRFFKRMRMDNSRTMLYMSMHKHRNAAVVHNKAYRQQPFHIFYHCLFHRAPITIEGAKIQQIAETCNVRVVRMILYSQSLSQTNAAYTVRNVLILSVYTIHYQT